MNRLSRRSPRALAVCGLFVACLALLPAFNTSPRAAEDKSCADLKRWALSYSDRSLTIAELAGLNRAERRAVFNVISPIVRSQLVQEHLGQVAQRSDLSPVQLAFIKEGIGFATPTFYTRREPAAMQAFEEFWRRASPAFSSPEQRAAWLDLGPVNSTPVPPTYSFLDRLLGVAKLHAQYPPCECNANYGYMECESGYCAGGGCGQYWGCGPAWAYMCDGLCAP